MRRYMSTENEAAGVTVTLNTLGTPASGHGGGGGGGGGGS